MQVIVLDRHAPADARIDRHRDTILRSGIKTIRIRMSRPDENINREKSCRQKDGIIELVPFNRLPLIFQKISQYVIYSLPSFLRRVCPYEDYIGMNNEEKTIIHVHDPDMLGLANWLKNKRFPGAVIVYDRHEVFEKAGGLYGFVSSIFEKINARGVDGVVGIAQIYEEGNKNIFSRAMLTSVPNYPLFTEYNHCAIQNKINLFEENSEIILSYIGSLNHRYDRDVLLLLKLLELVLEHNPKARVFIGGKTDSEELILKFNNLMEKYGNRFQYPGYISREKTREITELSHIGFFLLRPESNYWVKSSPNKFYEYLTTGNIAVVRADIDAEIPSDSVMMYDRWTTDEKIINDVLALLKEPIKIKQMMQSAYQQGLRFCYENVESNYLELYQALFNEK